MSNFVSNILERVSMNIEASTTLMIAFSLVLNPVILLACVLIKTMKHFIDYYTGHMAVMSSLVLWTSHRPLTKSIIGSCLISCLMTELTAMLLLC